MLITNISLQLCSIMTHCWAQSDAPFSSDPVFATPLCSTRKSPQIPPSHVVIFGHLASAELPKPRSTSQVQSAKRFLRVNNTAPSSAPIGRGLGIKFYFLMLYLYSKMSIFNGEFIAGFSVFFMCPLVRSGNHRWELHGSLRQWLPVVPAGWDTAGEVQAK